MSVDETTLHLSRLVSTLAEDTIFVLAGDERAAGDPPFEGLAERRSDAYARVLRGKPVHRMGEAYGAWLIGLCHAMAPLAAPDWLPMGEVLRAHVTLEAGPRGLRSLFTSKLHDDDVLRVTSVGTLAARLLRSVLAADGPIDAEEALTIAAFVGSLGLPAEEREALILKESAEPLGPMPDSVDAKVARALLRGAWLAAAWDGVDPREEAVIRAFAAESRLTLAEVEAARADALSKVEAKRLFGLAAVDYVRAVLRDRVPGIGETMPSLVAALLLPRLHRDEGTAPIKHRAPVTLAGRYRKLGAEERTRALGIAWAAALHDDPGVARAALLRARFDQVALDLESDGEDARALASGWMSDVLANRAKALAATTPDPATSERG